MALAEDIVSRAKSAWQRNKNKNKIFIKVAKNSN